MNIRHYAGMLLCLGVILCAPFVEAQERPNPCYSIDALLSSFSARETEFIVVGPPLGALLAHRHEERSPYRYELDHPVTTVLISKAPDGTITLGIQIGEMVCAPWEMDLSRWRDLTSDLWGRGA